VCTRSSINLGVVTGDVHASPQPEQEWVTIRIFEGVRESSATTFIEKAVEGQGDMETWSHAEKATMEARKLERVSR
jgi:hypothetical protein